MQVLVIHRSPVIARGLTLLIESAGGAASEHRWRGYDELRQNLRTVSADLVLVDPEIPRLEFERLIATVSEMADAAAVALISMSHSSEHMEQAVSAGAQGYVSLNSSADEFMASLRLLAEGHVVATGPEVVTLADVAVETVSGDGQFTALTVREREIARLVAKGLTNRQLAERLYLSEGTIKVHIRNIFRKLGMSNRSALTSYAHRTGLVG